MSVPMAELPSDQRPRERLTAIGPGALTDAELLAVVMRNGRVGRSALEIATELITEHGGLAALAQARPEELTRRCGVGEVKAATIVAAFHLGARSRAPCADAPRLRDPADIATVARPMFLGARVERLVVLVCDARDQVRQKVIAAEGCVDRVPLPIREILNVVLRNDGRAFALAHNHPSGSCRPSAADRRATEMLAAAANTVGLRFLDHVVVAGEEWTSATSGAAGGSREVSSAA